MIMKTTEMTMTNGTRATVCIIFAVFAFAAAVALDVSAFSQYAAPIVHRLRTSDDIITMRTMSTSLHIHGYHDSLSSLSRKPVERPFRTTCTAILRQISSSSSSLSSSSSSSSSTTTGPSVSTDNTRALPPEQLDFVLGYLNKHHSDLLIKLTETFTTLGQEKAKRNAWSGGSYRITSATITHIDTSRLTLDVDVQQRSSSTSNNHETSIELDAMPLVKIRSNSIENIDSYLKPIPISSVSSIHSSSSSSTSTSATGATTIHTPLDEIVRKLCRLCWIVNQPTVTGKLIQLGIQLQQPNSRRRSNSAAAENDDDDDVDSTNDSIIGDNDDQGGIGQIRDNLYLNQVPHNRYVRQYFYDLAATAVLDAVIMCSEDNNNNSQSSSNSNSNVTIDSDARGDGAVTSSSATGGTASTATKESHSQLRVSNRMQVISLFPETNPSMDSYRIGTLLELTRTIAIRLVEENLRVRICVQQSMGVGIFTGLPKQLGGVAKLLQLMDWQSGEGEENEGMVGTYLNFGAVGPEHVQPKDDIFIIIAPQSMVGVDSSIIPSLEAMVEAAGDRPVILINPDLSDKVSSQGQQNIRGRQQRLDFANSFDTVWHFQNIYVSGTSYFPILGSIYRPGPTSSWIAHQRRDLINNEGEVYVPVLAGEIKPTGEQILDAFEN